MVSVDRTTDGYSITGWITDKLLVKLHELI